MEEAQSTSDQLGRLPASHHPKAGPMFGSRRDLSSHPSACFSQACSMITSERDLLGHFLPEFHCATITVCFIRLTITPISTIPISGSATILICFHQQKKSTPTRLQRFSATARSSLDDLYIVSTNDTCLALLTWFSV